MVVLLKEGKKGEQLTDLDVYWDIPHTSFWHDILNRDGGGERRSRGDDGDDRGDDDSYSGDGDSDDSDEDDDANKDGERGGGGGRGRKGREEGRTRAAT